MNKTILLIDDDIDFKSTFQMEAQQRNIDIVHKRSLEGLRQVLPALRRSLFLVVLDIKCLTSESQVKEDNRFVGAAIAYLDSNCPGFPRIILTGDDAAFENFQDFHPGEIIFQKTPDGIISAFEKIVYFCNNSADVAAASTYHDIFSMFDNGYYDQAVRGLLLNVVTSGNETDFTKMGGIFRDIRALQENIYKFINQKNKLIVPNSVFKTNGMIIFNDLMKHLNGNPSKPGAAPISQVYQNSAIFQISNSLYWICGHGVHASPGETYRISNYTIRAQINGLLELFLWSKQYLK